MDELVPLPQEMSQEQISDIASDLKDIGVSKDLEALMARGLHSNRLPRALRSQKAAEAFMTTFDIIGGVPRLALWADRNPDKFYALVARIIPATVAPVVASLPDTGSKSKLDDMPWVSEQRLKYRLTPAGGEGIEDATPKLTEK